MKRIFFAVIASLALSHVASAQAEEVLARKPYKLNVAVTPGGAFKEQIKASPYILADKSIQLYPGEMVYVEIEADSGVIRGMKAVRKVTHPAKTVLIRFDQNAKNDEHVMMLLTVENPFPYTLTYSCKMRLLLPKRWMDTDVLPVQPKLSGIETWGDIITSISLSNLSLQPAKADAP